MTEVHRIDVRPFGERSWSVSFGSEPSEVPMLFRSGARAEAAAKSLAIRLADDGTSVEVVIGLRDGTVAARFIAARGKLS